MKIIILGPPGSGKGTQAKRIAKQMRIAHLSTGEMARRMAKQNNALGRRVRSIMKAGRLLPDAVVKKMLERRMRGSFVLDGFPRNIRQAKMLEAARIDAVVCIEVSDKAIAKRLAKRWRKERREDDKPGIVKKRLRVYRRETRPLIAYYRKKGILKRVNGGQSVARVAKDIRKALGS